MHQPVWEGIEAYLVGKPDATFLRHIEECAECREAVEAMDAQADLIRVLKAPADLDPAPGFYARVMERIDAQKANSIWSVFLEPLFAKRVVYASAVLTLLLGVFLFTSPKDEMMAGSMPEQILSEEAAPPPTPLDDLEQDRNVVFVQFATYQE